VSRATKIARIITAAKPAPKTKGEIPEDVGAGLLLSGGVGEDFGERVSWGEGVAAAVGARVWAGRGTTSRAGMVRLLRK
jgi:hypothetical protein